MLSRATAGAKSPFKIETVAQILALLQNAHQDTRSVALVIIARSDRLFIATSCRTSLRILPMASRGNACNHLDMLRGLGPFAAVSACALRSSASGPSTKA